MSVEDDVQRWQRMVPRERADPDNRSLRERLRAAGLLVLSPDPHLGRAWKLDVEAWERCMRRRKDKTTMAKKKRTAAQKAATKKMLAANRKKRGKKATKKRKSASKKPCKKRAKKAKQRTSSTYCLVSPSTLKVLSSHKTKTRALEAMAKLTRKDVPLVVTRSELKKIKENRPKRSRKKKVVRRARRWNP